MQYKQWQHSNELRTTSTSKYNVVLYLCLHGFTYVYGNKKKAIEVKKFFNRVHFTESREMISLLTVVWNFGMISIIRDLFWIFGDKNWCFGKILHPRLQSLLKYKPQKAAYNCTISVDTAVRLVSE